MNQSNAPPKIDYLTQLYIAYGVKRDYGFKLPFTMWLKILGLKEDIKNWE
jgi:hypothetical protein